VGCAVFVGGQVRRRWIWCGACVPLLGGDWGEVLLLFWDIVFIARMMGLVNLGSGLSLAGGCFSSCLVGGIVGLGRGGGGGAVISYLG
jgi:hypothetical protein